MACNAPNGNCTDASPCGCGTSGTATPTPAVPLPRCNFALPDGVYQRATVVVQGGCIVELRNGEPEVYTPDQCCIPGSGGEGATGPRGLPGPPGQAASVDVETTISQTGTAWTVQNVGTTTNAIFRFTAPVPALSGNQNSGYDGRRSGFSVTQGLVQTIPPAIGREFSAEPIANSQTASMYTLNLGYDGDPDNGRVKLLSSFDGLLAAAKEYTDEKHEEQDVRLNALDTTIAGLLQRVNQLETSLAALTADYNAYKASHP